MTQCVFLPAVLGLLACTAAERASNPRVPLAPMPPSVRPSGHDSLSGETARALAHGAWLIVVGRARVHGTDDGFFGTIAIEEQLKGEACGPEVSFLSEPFRIDERVSRVYFLVPEELPSGVGCCDGCERVSWRLLGNGERLSFPVELRETILPTARDPLPVEMAAVRVLGPELALLRATDQHRSGPYARPAMLAAERVFAGVRFVGLTHDEVRRLLGEAAESSDSDGESWWLYRFHDGEVGTLRKLLFESGRVARVVEIPTE